MPTSGDNQDKENPSSSEDSDLRILNARRMLELRKKMSSQLAAQQKAEAQKANPARKELTDREIVLKALRERGDEVLAAAEVSVPEGNCSNSPKARGHYQGRKNYDYNWGRFASILQGDRYEGECKDD